jgi:hypothetical protein
LSWSRLASRNEQKKCRPVWTFLELHGRQRSGRRDLAPGANPKTKNCFYLCMPVKNVPVQMPRGCGGLQISRISDISDSGQRGVHSEADEGQIENSCVTSAAFGASHPGATAWAPSSNWWTPDCGSLDGPRWRKQWVGHSRHRCLAADCRQKPRGMTAHSPIRRRYPPSNHGRTAMCRAPRLSWLAPKDGCKLQQTGDANHASPIRHGSCGDFVLATSHRRSCW